MVTNAIERAQKQVEAQNFSVRKHLLEYDDVMNKQRESIYALRRELLEGKIHLTEDERRVDTPRVPADARRGAARRHRRDATPASEVDAEEWDVDALTRDGQPRCSASTPTELDGIDLDGMTADEIRDALWAPIQADVRGEGEAGRRPSILRRVERDIMLQIVDAQWKDHLYSLDHLKEGIGLRGYGQRDPLVEYKKESFALFQAMKDRVEEEIVRYLWRLRRSSSDGPATAPVRPAPPAPRRPPQITLNAPSGARRRRRSARSRGGAAARGAGAQRRRSPRAPAATTSIKTVKRDEPKVGRNDPCPCGSGKKYKKCHGAASQRAVPGCSAGAHSRQPMFAALSFED